MTEEQMENRALQVLGQFTALKHDTLKQRVLADGGNYTLAAAQAFDAVIDKLVLNGWVSRDQPHGWLRLVGAGKPSQASGRSKTHGRLRSGSAP